MLPGSLMVLRVSRAARSTARWVLSSCALPIGRPMGKSTNTLRGGLILSVDSLTLDKPTVGMPSASMARCISPTDWLQSPQPGVSTTMPTPASFSLIATSGAELPIRYLSWVPVMWPMKE